MQLTVPETAKLLHVSEDLVYQWIRYEGLPASRLSDRYRINSIRLFEWANKQDLPIQFEGGVKEPILAKAIEAGQLFEALECQNIMQFSEQIGSYLAQQTRMEAQYISDLLESRGAAAWDEAESSIFVPRPRALLVLPIKEAQVFMAHTTSSILPSQSTTKHDNKQIIFLIGIPRAVLHLTILSRLTYALRDPEIQALIRSAADKTKLASKLQALGA